MRLSVVSAIGCREYILTDQMLGKWEIPLDIFPIICYILYGHKSSCSNKSIQRMFFRRFAAGEPLDEANGGRL